MWRNLAFVLTVCVFASLLWMQYQGYSLFHPWTWRAPGHMKPFGCCRPRKPVHSVNSWPTPSVFIENYLEKSRPLIIKNGAKISPAFEKWTDEYFLKELELPVDSTMNIETGKKEHRGNPVSDMNFREWVKIYNNSDNYLVDDIPKYLGKDVLYPPSIQCSNLAEFVYSAIMWFSSGGTKSVIHTDSADNIMCLYRGRKDMVLVNPHKYGSKVPMDVSKGAYSTIDVDRADYVKFPGLAEVEFNIAQLKAGDCLFIPYLWIHQVNSYGSNLAVNVWIYHEVSMNLDLSKCPDKYDANLTLDTYELSGVHRYGEKKNVLDDFIKAGRTMSMEQFIGGMVEDVENFKRTYGIGFMEPLKAIFTLLDKNKDLSLDSDEMKAISDEERQKVTNFLQQVIAIREAAERDMDDQSDQDSDDTENLNIQGELPQGLDKEEL